MSVDRDKLIATYKKIRKDHDDKENRIKSLRTELKDKTHQAEKFED